MFAASAVLRTCVMGRGTWKSTQMVRSRYQIGVRLSLAHGAARFVPEVNRDTGRCTKFDGQGRRSRDGECDELFGSIISERRRRKPQQQERRCETARRSIFFVEHNAHMFHARTQIELLESKFIHNDSGPDLEGRSSFSSSHVGASGGAGAALRRELPRLHTNLFVRDGNDDLLLPIWLLLVVARGGCQC
jgi:hypothetical protein